MQKKLSKMVGKRKQKNVWEKNTKDYAYATVTMQYLLDQVTKLHIIALFHTPHELEVRPLIKIYNFFS